MCKNRHFLSKLALTFLRQRTVYQMAETLIKTIVEGPVYESSYDQKKNLSYDIENLD